MFSTFPRRSHIGPLKTPAEEWDPRVTLEPNFYYDQEDILLEYHRRTGVEWGVVMPAASEFFPLFPTTAS